ncbi:MAG: DMT family transporter [Spirochaetia bacterium]|jgi:drug/metabolite transporter (DMT)-like permease
MTQKPVSATAYLPLLVSCLFWALGHPVGRIILKTVHPFHLGAINLIVGFIVLLAYLAATGRLRLLGRFSTADLLSSLALGAVGFALYQVLTFSALSRIPASVNAVLVSTNIMLIALFSVIFLRERVTWARAVGIIGAFAGVALVTFNRGFALNGGLDLTGCGFSLLAAVSFAAYTILGKRLVERNDPLIVTSLALFSGAVLLTAFSAVTIGFAPLRSAGGDAWWLMILLGATMIGIAYPLWFDRLKRLPASRASAFIYLTPVLAVILSFLILGEHFSWPFYLGGGLVLGGVVISSSLR